MTNAYHGVGRSSVTAFSLIFLLPAHIDYHTLSSDDLKNYYFLIWFLFVSFCSIIMSPASRNLALVHWVGMCISSVGLSALGPGQAQPKALSTYIWYIYIDNMSEWTVLLSRWFQAMIVLGNQECIHVLFSVALCSICQCSQCSFLPNYWIQNLLTCQIRSDVFVSRQSEMYLVAALLALTPCLYCSYMKVRWKWQVHTCIVQCGTVHSICHCSCCSFFTN